MKKLKLDHELAQQVLQGKKTSTWRLFDDKDLTVNDQVELIDKVDPDKPATWRSIGTVRIVRVIEKRLGDIQADDYEGHEPHANPEARLRVFRHYYGNNVSYDTPVKLVHFSRLVSVGADVGVLKQGRVRHVVLYADGGSRGNPGHSASGFVLIGDNDEVLVDKGVYLGVTTNNQAEYQALRIGLEEARAMGAQEVDVRLDSMLVINQMKGIFKVKNRELWPIYTAINQLVTNFKKVTFTHVPREMNKLADAAVNRVLDEATHKSSSIDNNRG